MTQPAIAVGGLSLSIGAFRLDKLDFALSGGEILVILGPNGSGKSVTLGNRAPPPGAASTPMRLTP